MRLPRRGGRVQNKGSSITSQTATVPFQVVEFIFDTTAAGGKTGLAGVLKLLLGTVLVPVSGYFSEATADSRSVRVGGFAVGICGGAFIRFVIFTRFVILAGESSGVCSPMGTPLRL